VEGKQGPAGPPGAAGAPGQPGTPGAKGDKGEPATRLWAVVNAAGATSHGANVVSSANLFTGGYEVIFNRDVSACSYQATQSTIPGETIVQPRSSNANGVFVGTYSSAGAAQDRSFHLAVFC